MTNLFKTILDDSPINIKKAIVESLDLKAEVLLKEEHKMVVANVFSKPLELKESVQRKPWTKKDIREALEKAAVRKLELDNLNEDHSHINHMHNRIMNHGFNLVSSGSHAESGHSGSFYKHPEGHTVSLNHNTKEYHIMSKNGTLFHGNGHDSMKRHLKQLNELSY